MMRDFISNLLLAVTLCAADAPTPQALSPTDRLQIREAQLGLAQAHIARLQAELEVKDHQMAVQALEKKIANLIAELSKQYGCAECQLQNDFTWKKPAPSEPVSTPAPNGGQSENKE